MLITKEGNRNFVKLLDFGLARTEFQSRVTQTGMVVGTINYLSPEQIASAEFSSASDIYSLGILFYEMTTGKNPFPGRQTPELMKQILDDIPEDPIDIRTDLPSGLNDLIMRMIEKEKEDRPDVNEVLEELRKIHQSLVNS